MSRLVTKDIPEGFAEFARKENDRQLGERFSLPRKVVIRMRNNLNIEAAAKRRPAIGVPDDFLTAARTGTTAELARRYNVGETTILRWCKMTGAKTQTMRMRAATDVGAGVPYARTISSTTPPGVAPAAARFLRERGYRPVYSRVIEDKKLADQYVVGRQKMSSSEMVDLAAEKGFDKSAMYI